MAKRILSSKLDLPAEALGAGLVRHSLFVALKGSPGRQLGGLAQEPGRIAFGIPDNKAPLRIGGVGIDARRLEGQCIGKATVPAGVREEHRICRAHLTQAMVGRDPIIGLGGCRIPTLLVPSPPRDPCTGLRGCGRLGHDGHDLVPAGGPGKIEDHPGLTQPQKMSVPFNEPRGHHTPIQLDHSGAPPRQSLDCLAASYRQNATISDRHALSLGRLGIHRDDGTTHQNEVGGVRVVRATAAQEEEGEDERRCGANGARHQVWMGRHEQLRG